MHFAKFIFAAILSCSATVLSEPIAARGSSIAEPYEHAAALGTSSLTSPLEERQLGKGRKSRKRKGLLKGKSKAKKAKKARRLVKRVDDDDDAEVVVPALADTFDFLDEAEPPETEDVGALEKRQAKKGGKGKAAKGKAAKGKAAKGKAAKGKAAKGGAAKGKAAGGTGGAAKGKAAKGGAGGGAAKGKGKGKARRLI